MKPYLEDSDFQLWNGDAREVLRELPAESVHMCITSPPFFGLRDYGCEGQIGLESTPEEWVAQLVSVFEEVKRVLRKDGTLWVECGDSYCAAQGGRQSSVGEMPAQALKHDAGLGTGDAGSWQSGATTKLTPGRGQTDLKPKDLIGQPFLLAFALREAGWYWRNVCIWHKPNPMPESVRDRFTVAHSYVLLFSKSPRYFFDAEAVRESFEGGNMRNGFRGEHDGPSAYIGQQGPQPNSLKNTLDGSEGEAPRGPDGRRQTAVKAGDNSIQHRDGERWPNSGRNARSVWTIATEPLPFEHYAAFPQALAERAIKAGTSERGCCPECGAPWVREVETQPSSVAGEARNVGGRSDGFTQPKGGAKEWALHVAPQTVGWRQGCECVYDAAKHGLFPRPIPCTVLDPFLGSGTTALVARRLGCKCIGIELNEAYCRLAAERTKQLSLLGEDLSATRETAVSS